jgi:hypothetical protein
MEKARGKRFGGEERKGSLERERGEKPEHREKQNGIIKWR